MQRAVQPCRQSGFTLLEMLVAITVLALLMVGLSQGVRTGFAFWSAQSHRSGETAELDATARVLRSLLTGIPTRSATAAAEASAIAFVGHPNQIDFVGDLPTGFGNSRRADITIALRGGRLVLAWTAHRHEQSSAAPPVPAEIELTRSVDKLEFGYWGDPSRTGAAAWLAQWDGPALPELIRVRLGFVKGDTRRWPDLVAAPQLWTAGS
jgi:general secretion pathway protein J